MDAAHKRTLTENRIFLIQNIDYNDIEDGLLDIFNSEMLDCVRRKQDHKDQIRDVLNDLPKRGPTAYDTFIQILTEAGYDDVVEQLDESLESIRLQKPILEHTQFRDCWPGAGGSVTSRAWNSPLESQRAHTAVSGEDNRIHPNESYKICEFWCNITELSKLRALYSRNMSEGSHTLLQDQREKCLKDHRAIHRMMQCKQTTETLEQLLKLNDSLNEELSAYKDCMHRLKIEAYDTKRPSRGHMLIFNNSKFSRSSGYGSRSGSEKDTENLTSTFQNFGFVVTTCENKTVVEMKHCLEKFHQEAVTDPLCSSVVIVLASHGRREKRGIVATDGGVFDLDWVICRFCRDCAKPLAGKPKMIILQCCRGKQFDVVENPTDLPKPVQLDAAESLIDLPQSVLLEKDAEHITEEEATRPATRRAQLADYLIAHSTVHGNVSWRDRESGSWFIQAICDIFREHSPNEHVMDMLIKVNERLSTMQGSIVVQQPNPECMLTHKWFLWPS